jgi:hypothetical protein
MNPEALARAFGNTPEDIQANRNGQLTARQHKEVLRATREDAAFVLGTGAMLAGVLWSILYLVHRSGKLLRFDASITFGEVVLLLVAGGFPLATIAFGLYMCILQRNVRRATNTCVLEGPLQRSALQRRGIAIHRITLQARTFAVTEQVYAILNDAQPYRVYFVDGSDVVVGIEAAQRV